MESYETPPTPPITGPSGIGQIAIAIGAYTEIVDIIAPAEAAAGDLVTVEVRVRNIWNAAFTATVTGRYDNVDISPTEDYASIDPGATYSFYFSFTMPNNDASIRVWSFYRTGTEWYQDDYGSVDIALAIELLTVSVKLKNPPSRGNYWRLILFNEVWGESLTVGMHIPVDEPMTLDLPAGWSFPLYIDIFIYELNVPPFNIVYKVQSAYGPDWLDYKDIIIPDSGSYYFNVATEQFEKIEVVPEFAGRVAFALKWYEGLAGWKSVTPGQEIPYNQEIHLAIYCQNTGTVDLKGHVDLEVTYPDGTRRSLSAVSNQDRVVAPGSGWVVLFEPFISSQAGTYTVVATLSSEGQVLDTVTFELPTTAVPEPEFAGTISRKELEYDETWDTIPVSNVPQGQRGLVHIWGRNDTPVTQQMGISWIVKDPDGITVEEYSTWEAWPYTGSGAEHGFIGGRFNLDKAGAYTINVGLFMNLDDPQVVDQYIGELCTVAAVVPEPEFAGFGVTEYIKR